MITSRPPRGAGSHHQRHRLPLTWSLILLLVLLVLITLCTGKAQAGPTPPPPTAVNANSKLYYDNLVSGTTVLDFLINTFTNNAVISVKNSMLQMMLVRATAVPAISCRNLTIYLYNVTIEDGLNLNFTDCNDASTIHIEKCYIKGHLVLPTQDTSSTGGSGSGSSSSYAGDGTITVIDSTVLGAEPSITMHLANTIWMYSANSYRPFQYLNFERVRFYNGRMSFTWGDWAATPQPQIAFKSCEFHDSVLLVAGAANSVEVRDSAFDVAGSRKWTGFTTDAISISMQSGNTSAYVTIDNVTCAVSGSDTTRCLNLVSPPGPVLVRRSTFAVFFNATSTPPVTSNQQAVRIVNPGSSLVLQDLDVRLTYSGVWTLDGGLALAVLGYNSAASSPGTGTIFLERCGFWVDFTAPHSPEWLTTPGNNNVISSVVNFFGLRTSDITLHEVSCRFGTPYRANQKSSWDQLVGVTHLTTVLGMQNCTSETMTMVRSLLDGSNVTLVDSSDGGIFNNYAMDFVAVALADVMVSNRLSMISSDIVGADISSSVSSGNVGIGIGNIGFKLYNGKGAVEGNVSKLVFVDNTWHVVGYNSTVFVHAPQMSTPNGYATPGIEHFQVQGDDWIVTNSPEPVARFYGGDGALAAFAMQNCDIVSNGTVSADALQVTAHTIFFSFANRLVRSEIFIADSTFFVASAANYSNTNGILTNDVYSSVWSSTSSGSGSGSSNSALEPWQSVFQLSCVRVMKQRLTPTSPIVVIANFDMTSFNLGFIDPASFANSNVVEIKACFTKDNGCSLLLSRCAPFTPVVMQASGACGCACDELRHNVSYAIPKFTRCNTSAGWFGDLAVYESSPYQTRTRTGSASPIPLMRLAGTVPLPGGAMISPASRIADSNGAFVYFGSSTFPGQIYKINAKTHGFVGSLVFSAGTNSVRGFYLDDAADRLYACHEASSIRITVNTASTLTYTGQQATFGVSSLRACVGTHTAPYIYTISYSLPAAIARVQRAGSTVALSGSLSLPAGHNYGWSLAIDPSENYLYAALNVIVDKLWIGNTSAPFTVALLVGFLSLPPGSTDLRFLLIDRTGSTMYCLFSESAQRIVRVHLSNFTVFWRDNAFGPLIIPPEYYSGAQIRDAVLLYPCVSPSTGSPRPKLFVPVTDTPSGVLLLIDTATPSTAMTIESSVPLLRNGASIQDVGTTLFIGYWDTMPLVVTVVEVDDFELCKTNTTSLSPSKSISEDRTASFSVSRGPVMRLLSSAALPASATVTAGARAIDPINGNFVYFGGFTAPGQIYKIDARTGQYVGSVAFTATSMNQVRGLHIDPTNTVIVAAHDTLGGCGFTTTFVSSFTFTTNSYVFAGMAPRACVGTRSSSFVYYVTDEVPALIGRFNVSGTTLVNASFFFLNTGHDRARAAVIDSTEQYMYVGLATTSGTPSFIAKIYIANPTGLPFTLAFRFVASRSLGSGNTDLRSLVYVSSSNTLYCICGATSGRVVRVNLTAFVILPADAPMPQLVLPSSIYNSTANNDLKDAVAFTPCGATAPWLFLPISASPGNGSLLAVDTATMSVLQSLTIPRDAAAIQDAPAGSRLFIGHTSTAARVITVVKVDGIGIGCATNTTSRSPSSDPSSSVSNSDTSSDSRTFLNRTNSTTRSRSHANTESDLATESNAMTDSNEITQSKNVTRDSDTITPNNNKNISHTNNFSETASLSHTRATLTLPDTATAAGNSSTAEHTQSPVLSLTRNTATHTDSFPTMSHEITETATRHRPLVRAVPVPVSRDLSTTAFAITTVTGAANVVVVQQLQRNAALLKIVRCGQDTTVELPITSSPTQMVIGDDWLRFHRGAVIGNTIIGFALVLLYAAAIPIVALITKTSWPAALLKIRFPSYALIPISLIAAPTAVSGAVLLWYGDGAADVLLMVLLGIFLPFVPICCLVTIHFEHRKLNLPLRRVKTVPRDPKLARSCKTRFMEFWYYAVRPRSMWPEQHPFINRYFPIFYPIRVSWFPALDFATTIFVSIMGGLASSVTASKTVCISSAVISLVVLALHFGVLLIARPTLGRAATVIQIALSSMACVSALIATLILVGRDVGEGMSGLHDAEGGIAIVGGVFAALDGATELYEILNATNKDTSGGKNKKKKKKKTGTAEATTTELDENGEQVIVRHEGGTDDDDDDDEGENEAAGGGVEMTEGLLKSEGSGAVAGPKLVIPELSSKSSAAAAAALAGKPKFKALGGIFIKKGAANDDDDNDDAAPSAAATAAGGAGRGLMSAKLIKLKKAAQTSVITNRVQNPFMVGALAAHATSNFSTTFDPENKKKGNFIDDDFLRNLADDTADLEEMADLRKQKTSAVFGNGDLDEQLPEDDFWNRLHNNGGGNNGNNDDEINLADEDLLQNDAPDAPHEGEDIDILAELDVEQNFAFDDGTEKFENDPGYQLDDELPDANGNNGNGSNNTNHADGAGHYELDDDEELVQMRTKVSVGGGTGKQSAEVEAKRAELGALFNGRAAAYNQSGASRQHDMFDPYAL